MNIFEALRVSHDTQRELAARLTAAQVSAEERERVFGDLKRELLAHETAEERCFYVPLFEHDATVDASRHAIAEHHEMDEMVEDMEKLQAGGAAWMEHAKKLAHKVNHHLEEEERKFFQQAGKVLTERQKTDLARVYEAEFLTLRAGEHAA
ncbi:MAG: hemerythrin domain-containing protein [Burkholderiales bacterium]|nr:hemerythrin domain-containing protein [Burkholderiales bacterium]